MCLTHRAFPYFMFGNVPHSFEVHSLFYTYFYSELKGGRVHDQYSVRCKRLYEIIAQYQLHLVEKIEQEVSEDVENHQDKCNALAGRAKYTREDLYF